MDLADGLDDFRAKTGAVFSKPFIWLDAERMPPHKWWRKWESGALKRVAVVLTGLRAGAGAAEHRWKKHKQTTTKNPQPDGARESSRLHLLAHQPACD